MSGATTITSVYMGPTMHRWELTCKLATQGNVIVALPGVSHQDIDDKPDSLLPTSKGILKDVYRSPGIVETRIEKYSVLVMEGLEYTVNWEQVDTAVIRAIQHNLNMPIHVRHVGPSLLQRIRSWLSRVRAHKALDPVEILAEFTESHGGVDLSRHDIQHRLQDYELTAWASAPTHGDSSIIHQWIDPPAEPVRIFRFVREGMWIEGEDFAPVELFNKLPDSIIVVIEVANQVFGGLISHRLDQIHKRELERLQGLGSLCHRFNDPGQRNNVRSIAS